LQASGAGTASKSSEGPDNVNNYSGEKRPGGGASGTSGSKNKSGTDGDSKSKSSTKTKTGAPGKAGGNIAGKTASKQSPGVDNKSHSKDQSLTPHPVVTHATVFKGHATGDISLKDHPLEMVASTNPALFMSTLAKTSTGNPVNWSTHPWYVHVEVEFEDEKPFDEMEEDFQPAGKDD